MKLSTLMMHTLADMFTDRSASVAYLSGAHDPWLVLFSVVLAMFASFMALQIGGMARDSDHRLQRQTAIATGAVALGGGIWSMHFIGMLAFDLCTRVAYDPAMTLLSMLPGMAASWVALSLLSSLRISRRQVLGGGLLVGAGIGSMHYSGMAAMRTALTMQYDLPLFLLSIAVAVVLAMLALWIRFGMERLNLKPMARLLASAAVMGLAISGMHYTGMLALRWSGTPEPGAGLITLQAPFVALAVGIITVTLTVFVAAANGLLRYRQLLRHSADSERQYRTLIRNIPGVSFHAGYGGEWPMLFISDAVTTLTGWTPDDFTSGRVHLKDLFHPDDRQRVHDTCVQAATARRDFENVYRIVHRDGRERWVRESSGPVPDSAGVVRWIDGVLIDITESQLRTAEYEGKVTAIGRALAVIEFDLQGTILTANQNYLDLVGYRLDEIVGRHHRMFCEPDYVASAAYQGFWDHLAAGGFDAAEYRRLGKDGREVWIEASYNPIFDADGKPFKVVKFATDVSGRRAMQESLRMAKERAEQAAAAKTAFLANMSHEIRTPMNAIIGFTEVLLGTDLDELQRRHLGTVRKSARSLLELLNDILDTAKLEKGAAELELADFSLPEVIGQVVEALHVTARDKQLELGVDYDTGAGQYFVGDARRLQQVLTNLVGNALKFTERGAVRIAVGRRQGQLHIAVRDTGIGIAADRLDKIFAPFTQADSSMSRRFGGTGLGTTISLQLVELMGGTITVESTLGVGSVFHVLLPLARGKPVAPAAELRETPLPPLRILAADDAAQNLELLQIRLGQGGHQVTLAGDGEHAVRAYREGRYDIVLMDVQMPNMDGLEATRQIRAYERAAGRAATPVIALTASVLESDRRAAREAGMNGFASKPLEMHRLTAEIALLLGLSPAGAGAGAAPAAAASAQVDWQRGSALWGGRDTLRKAIVRYCEAHADTAARLAAELARGDAKAVHQRLHRVRGAAANLCLTEIERTLVALEQATGQGEPAGRLLSALDAAFAALARELAQEGQPQLGQAQPDTPAEQGTQTETDTPAQQAAQARRAGREQPGHASRVGAAAAPAAVAALAAVEREAALAALDALDAILASGQVDDNALAQVSALFAPHGQQAQLDAMRAAIDDFELERARALLQSLRLDDVST
ncbi:MHYT domain-containing protein [Oxalobacteraceae bacterium A2-2]